MIKYCYWEYYNKIKNKIYYKFFHKTIYSKYENDCKISVKELQRVT